MKFLTSHQGSLGLLHCSSRLARVFHLNRTTFPLGNTRLLSWVPLPQTLRETLKKASEEENPDIWDAASDEKIRLIEEVSDHILEQAFTYQDRKDSNKEIVDAFQKRAFNRGSARTARFAREKKHNPYVVIPAVPGCGKSAFLANFPYSEEYITYCKNKGQLPDSNRVHTRGNPLVSLFTFNSAMTTNSIIAPGLRLIFGLLLSLSSNFRSAVDWDEFFAHFHVHEGMKCREAVNLIREIWPIRPLFIGIDEIKQAGDPSAPTHRQSQEALMRDIADLMTNDGRTDVVISALSPHYITSLVSSSNRLMKYYPLRTLLYGDVDAQLKHLLDEFMKECEKAIDKWEIKKGEGRANSYVAGIRRNILRSVHLLASGHPRTLEHLMTVLKGGLTPSDQPKAPEKLGGFVPANSQFFASRLNPYNLINFLCDPEISNKVWNLTISPPANLDECDMLLKSGTFSSSDPDFREITEAPKCFIFSGSDQLYRIGTTLSSFLQMMRKIADFKKLTPLTAAAKILFNWMDSNSLDSDVLDNDVVNISEVWERCHAMSLISQYSTNRTSFTGVPYPDIVFAGHLSVVLAKEENCMNYKANTVFVAPKDHAGFDLLACLRGRRTPRLFLYQEVKIHRPNDNIKEILGDKLAQTLKYHVEKQLRTDMATVEMKDLTGVYFVMSVFGVDGVQQILDEEELDNYLAGQNEIKYSLALKFLKRYRNNVRLEGEAQIKATMIPTLLPFAQMVQREGREAAEPPVKPSKDKHSEEDAEGVKIKRSRKDAGSGKSKRSGEDAGRGKSKRNRSLSQNKNQQK